MDKWNELLSLARGGPAFKPLADLRKAGAVLSQDEDGGCVLSCGRPPRGLHWEAITGCILDLLDELSRRWAARDAA